jgi:hypothetical protein
MVGAIELLPFAPLWAALTLGKGWETVSRNGAR